MVHFQLIAALLLSVLSSAQVDAARLRSLAQIPFLPAHRHLASCPITDGVDYVGNDISHVSGVQASDCCTLCSQTSSCGAFTWTNFEGGTCWLKTAKGSTASNSGARSAVLEPDQPTCTLQDSVDYEGNDIANVRSNNSGGCCSICTEWPSCVAFTWSDFNDGTCWLKSAKGAVVPKAGRQSAEVQNLTGQCRLQNNVDFTGFDLSNEPGSNPGACCDSCKRAGSCRAYTWTDFNGGTCWLKTGKGAVVNKPGAVSSDLMDVLPSCSLESNMDYIGNDIADVPASRPADCCALCRARTGCSAFSWTNYNGGTCWLKAYRRIAFAKEGVTSGTIRV
ncbi:hypothetical protein PHYBOEH_003156 [Phytophthora boehmeriae]|uniref:Apple domain-containing protein n=1 Tax=Phytophthora boehmeriae TaxID=109152 RepID=A0A8T1WVH1_9STRA|nr:hypothetical protein PHYBOEH_003156 [Phytophthora boehmeriae]